MIKNPKKFLAFLLKWLIIIIPINNSSHKIDNNNKSIKSFYVKLKKLYKKDIENIVFVFELTGS